MPNAPESFGVPEMARHVRQAFARRSMWAFCVAVLAASIPTVGGSAQEITPDPARWRPLSYADLRRPSGADRTYADIWKDALDENNREYLARGDTRFRDANAPATEAHFVIWSAKKSVVVTVLDTAMGCTLKQAYPAAHASVKLCPLRIAVYEGLRVRSLEGGKACFLELEAGSAGDAAKSTSYAAYDVPTRTIRTGLIVDHTAVEGCSQAIPLPPQPNRM